jgi:hypothetical protein
MANLRVLFQNAANTSAITVSAAAGTLAASNLLTDIKSQVWRSTTTSGTITATMTAATTINCVVLPFTNLTNAATMRVRGYTNAADVVGTAPTIFDTTALACCPFTNAAVFGWDSNTPGVAKFSNGGGVYASLFFTGGSVRKIVVDLVDTGNPSGYIEASRLVTGAYWSPTTNADYGAQIGWNDNSQHTRNDAGDLLTDVKPHAKTLTLNFSNASPSDREALMKIMRNGMGSPLYISVFPNDSDKNLEQDYQIYGKLSQQSQIAIARYAAYSTGLTIDEI